MIDPTVPRHPLRLSLRPLGSPSAWRAGLSKNLASWLLLILILAFSLAQNSPANAIIDATDRFESHTLHCDAPDNDDSFKKRVSHQERDQIEGEFHHHMMPAHRWAATYGATWWKLPSGAARPPSERFRFRKIYTRLSRPPSR